MAKQNIQKVKEEEVLVDIAEVTKETQHWLEVYKKPIIYGVVGLAVLIGGWYAWNAYVDSNQKKAVQAIWKAEQLFERDSFAVALNNPGGGYEGFLGIISKYGSTPAGNMAHYYAGICYLNLGKFDEAIKELDSFSPSGEVSPTMKAGALADAYSEKQDFAKALKLYKEAASAGSIEDIILAIANLYLTEQSPLRVAYLGMCPVNLLNLIPVLTFQLLPSAQAVVDEDMLYGLSY